MDLHVGQRLRFDMPTGPPTPLSDSPWTTPAHHRHHRTDGLRERITTPSVGPSPESLTPPTRSTSPKPTSSLHIRVASASTGVLLSRISFLNSLLWRNPHHFWRIPDPPGRSPNPHSFPKSPNSQVRIRDQHVSTELDDPKQCRRYYPRSRGSPFRGNEHSMTLECGSPSRTCRLSTSVARVVDQL